MLLPAGFGLPAPAAPLVISDTTAASANFAVYHLVQLAHERGIPAALVDFRQEGAASHTLVLRKLGTKPPAFLAPSPLPAAPLPLFTSAGEPTLAPVFSALPKSGLVILDGLSELEAIGFSAQDVARFVRAARDAGVLLAATLRAELPDAEEVEQPELLQRLLRLGGCWWRIQGLASGRSADVTGEISRHTLGGEGDEDVPRANPLQYRLELGGVKTFAKGTGRGYL